MDKKKLALIHIIKKELNLSDAQYRDILQKSAGVTTSKDLTEEKFRKLMNYFVRSRHYRVNQHGLTLKQKMYIKHLVRDLSWDESHLSNFLNKYYHKQDITQLTKEEAIKVIEALKHIKASEHA